MRRWWRSEIGRVRRWRPKEGERGGEGRKKMKNRKAEEEKGRERKRRGRGGGEERQRGVTQEAKKCRNSG